MHVSLTHPVFSHLGQACLDRLEFMRPAKGPRLWLGPSPGGLSVSQPLDWAHHDPLKGSLARLPRLGYAVVIDTGSWQTHGLHKDWFSEVYKMLSDGGVYLFAGLGPSSLKELRQTLDQLGLKEAGGLLPQGLTEAWTDMHDLGDELQQAGLLSPVMESDPLRFSYQTPRQFLKDLRAWPRPGVWRATHMAKDGPRLGAQAFKAGFKALNPPQSAGMVLDWELVVGHAWKPEAITKKKPKTEGSGFSPLKFFRKKP